MNFFKYILILFVLFLSANQLTALSYGASNNSTVSSSSSSVQLLLNYTDDYKRQINNLFIKYEITNSEIVSGFNKNIAEIRDNITSALSLGDTAGKSQEFINAAVSDLKSINNKMKIYLDQEKILYKQRIMRDQEIYNVIGSRISPIIDKIIQGITNNLSTRKNLSDSEKEIVKSLIRLRAQNEKIRSFSSINFGSRDQMKVHFKDIIIAIRSEIVLIKQLSL